MSRKNSKVWAVTAYFNPVGYESRKRNFRIFRRHLDLPLVAVELAFNQSYDLGPDDAEILIQLRGGDVLWQKERLLNIAIQQTPASCDSVVWIDCDIVFERSDWAETIRRHLAHNVLLQPFRRVFQTQASTLGLTPLAQCGTRESLVFRLNNDSIPFDVFRTQGASMKWMYSPGHVWAGRREVLLEHGLYDAMVMGGGDKTIAAAAYGRFEDVVVAFNMNDSRAMHYRAWAEPLYAAVKGRVGSLDLDIHHLWHGSLDKRKYGSRYQHFADFDPRRDIARNEQGVWEWGTDKPLVHDSLAKYFRDRHEDAPPPDR